MPRFSDDPVLDFKVAEAVIAHGLEEQSEASKTAERERSVRAWKDQIKNTPAGG